MTSTRLSYPWKIVVAAAVVAVVIMAGREIPKIFSRLGGPGAAEAKPVQGSDIPSDQYRDTLSRVQDIIAVLTSSVPEVATPAMPLLDLGVDGLTRLELAESLESAFRIELPAKEFSAAATVEDLVQLVLKQQQESPQPR